MGNLRKHSPGQGNTAVNFRQKSNIETKMNEQKMGEKKQCQGNCNINSIKKYKNMRNVVYNKHIRPEINIHTACPTLCNRECTAGDGKLPCPTLCRECTEGNGKLPSP